MNIAQIAPVLASKEYKKQKDTLPLLRPVNVSEPLKTPIPDPHNKKGTKVDIIV